MPENRKNILQFGCLEIMSIQTVFSWVNLEFWLLCLIHKEDTNKKG